MDSFGQMGPTKDDYDTDLLGVATALKSGAVVATALADRATHYPLVLALDHGVSFAREADRDRQAGRVFVACEGRGAYWFDIGEVHFSYVNEKLGFSAPGDGEVVAEFLERLSRALNLAVTR